GHYSVQCYLDALAGAYRGWKERALAAGLVHGRGMACEQLARVCYHVPFCKMAKKAHVQVRRCDLDDMRSPWDVATEEAAAASSFRTQVETSLAACARIGNVYTGSLYLALAGLLDAGTAKGERIGLFSYGSGCTSEFFSGVVGPRVTQRVQALDLGGVLAAREQVTIAEYERIMGLTMPIERPRSGGFAFIGVEEHRRQYARS
ncbi:MAG TPA: hydroxymethylglutaryl-CoA synthase, partial [Kofleriaceae bacterium]|nr:hydroxymethylglutaryl-CoA synthase [Kofleriaceae bacterium]